MLAIDDFPAIGLAELGPATLLGRVDTKFAIPPDSVSAVLERCAPHYRALVVGGLREFAYSTLYFDTADLALYQAQHAGRVPRRKFRERLYVDSGERYMEIKVRDNHGWTRKSRVALMGAADPLDVLGDFPGDVVGGMGRSELRPVVTTAFRRITLVRNDLRERVTLDREVTFSADGRESGYRGVVFAEMKQESRGGSPFQDLMRELGSRPASLSKYALAIVTLGIAPKANRFKPTLSLLRRIGTPHVVDAVAG